MNLVLNACRGFGEDNPFLQCDIDKQDNSTYALCVHYQEQGNVGGKYERLELTCGRRVHLGQSPTDIYHVFANNATFSRSITSSQYSLSDIREQQIKCHYDRIQSLQNKYFELTLPKNNRGHLFIFEPTR